MSATSPLQKALAGSPVVGAALSAVVVDLGLRQAGVKNPQAIAAALAEHGIALIPASLVKPLNDFLTNVQFAGQDDIPDGHRDMSGADTISYACSLHSRVVRAARAAGMDMSTWVARLEIKPEDSECEPEDSEWLYFSDDSRWVANPAQADVRFGFEIQGNEPPKAPQDAKALGRVPVWEPLDEALKRHRRFQGERADDSRTSSPRG